MNHISCFGDSLIQGFPFTEENSWIAKVERLTDCKMINYGICGECCDDIADRLTLHPLLPEVTHVLFEGGMNDIIQGSPLTFTLSQIKKAVDFCHNQGRPFCLVLPWLCAAPELNPFIERMRSAMRQKFAASCYLVDFMPVFKKTVSQHHYFIGDGVHPTAKTYQDLGVFAAPLIKKWVDGKG